MGYRNYLYVVPKDVIERASRLDINELKDRDGFEYQSPYDLIGGKCVHEFGEIRSSLEDAVKSYSIPLFLNKDTHNYYSDYDAIVIGEEGLTALINEHREIVLGYLTENLAGTPEELWENTKLTMRFKQLELQHLYDPVKIRQEGRLPDSWVYEYSMFNLIHVHHTVDWSKNELVYMGW